jgi:hypothetical protein
LKTITYYTLLPLFMKWSKEYPLSLDNLRLRTKEWVELIPLGPDNEDINAISSKFFAPKGKSKVIQFQPNKVLTLYLELGHEQYRKVLDRLDELENEAVRKLFTDAILRMYLTDSHPMHVDQGSASATQNVVVVSHGEW